MTTLYEEYRDGNGKLIASVQAFETYHGRRRMVSFDVLDWRTACRRAYRTKTEARCHAKGLAAGTIDCITGIAP